ncbi:hypothetical protein JKP88DRAFT_69958 [Tribonema minus]|uniref:Uncharacterized protein n=1 Tax=Tribonema minus TaxID=303371 RepID=A0A835Z020_9STRA|nr:hypothetical protein JKP88DRAFT_69958 [Tribonema minus]
MQLVKAQVKEDAIRAQFQAAMAKKADLISIEVILLEDMSDCREQLVAELASTVTRVDRIDGVVAALPRSDDRSRARLYDWEDIQSLQDLLLESVQSMLDSDTKVAALRTKFEDAVRQKREVLGEIPAPSTVIEVVPEGGSGGEGAAQGSAALRPRVDLSSVSALSKDELSAAAGKSSKDAAVALGKTVAVGAQSLGDYLKSPKAQSLAATVVDLFQNTGGYFKAIGESFSVATKVFQQNTLPGEEITSFDTMFKTARDAVKSVQTSEEVAAALADVKQKGQAVPSTAGKIGQLAGEAIKDAQQNKELGTALAEALSNVQSALVALAGLGTKLASSAPPPGRMLPPSGPPGASATPIDVPSEASGGAADKSE